ncbi:hypothetical protein [Paenibacillus sp. Marseille-P2973]|uniref:hypothetical protein n=1 Tax=Paenibacillus sp. Marseille-P2973 TaxID=1871032 RepID=UPI001FFD85E7|nr:hypothetical protein [Paenibacillus sp. Marseille-P2973]
MLNKERMFAYNTNKRSYLEMVLVEKYIGKLLEIIYIDRAGNVSQRRIEVHAVKGDLVRATCLKTGEPRAFRKSNILAYAPVKVKGRDSDAS